MCSKGNGGSNPRTSDSEREKWTLPMVIYHQKEEDKNQNFKVKGGMGGHRSDQGWQQTSGHIQGFIIFCWLSADRDFHESFEICSYNLYYGLKSTAFGDA